ncbi:MAG: hypothetical protein J5617_00775 [Bacilli bacterium]|nr:hypothetical protein [Bacilli bacterium]
MYFLVALFLALLSAGLAFIFRKHKALHLEILAITYGAATLMWLIDCIAGAIKEGEFLSFEIPLDIWISIWTFASGLLFWGVITLVLYIKNKKQHLA